MQPWREIEVDEREAADLRSQGLLIEDKPKAGRDVAARNKEN